MAKLYKLTDLAKRDGMPKPTAYAKRRLAHLGIPHKSRGNIGGTWMITEKEWEIIKAEPVTIRKEETP